MRRVVERSAWWFISLLVIFACASCSLSQRSREAAGLIAAYGQAECVSPVRSPPQGGFAPPTWSQAIDVGTDLKAQIEAYGFVHGRVTVRYSDETVERVIADPGLYVYPYDVRIDQATHRLYAVASGFAGGLWYRTILYEYDLLARRVLRDVRVDIDALPPQCPSVANNALKLTAAARGPSWGCGVDVAAAAAYGER